MPKRRTKALRSMQIKKALELKRQQREERNRKEEGMQNTLPNTEEVERIHSLMLSQRCNQTQASLDYSLLDEFIQFIDESNNTAASTTTSEHSAKEDIGLIHMLPMPTPQPTIKDKANSSSSIRVNNAPSDREIKSLLSDNLEFSTTYSRRVNTSTITHNIDSELEQKAKRQKSHNLSDALTDEDRRIFMEFRYTRNTKPVTRYSEIH